MKQDCDGSRTTQTAVGSDNMFRMLAENSTDIIWVLNIETLKLTYVSPSVMRIRGYTPEEVTQLSLDNILTPDSYKRALLEIQEALKLDKSKEIDSEHIFLFEFEEYRRDGSIISSEARMRFVRDADGIPVEIYGITRDITDRKRIENALHVEHDLFLTIFENAPYIMMLVNKDGIVTNINHKGVEFSGKNKHDILHLFCGQVFNCINSFDGLGCGKNLPCLECPVRSRIANTFMTGEAVNEQEGRLAVIINSQEVYVDLLISTALVKTKEGIRVLVTIADITERKQVEEELRESEMRFSALFDNSPVPVIELDCSGISKRFNELRNLGVQDFREYFIANPKEVAAFTSLVKVTNVNQTSVVFFGAGSKEGVIAGMPDYFLSQSPTAYKEELIALADGSVRFENETPVYLAMRGDLTVYHILSVVPGYEQSLERVLVSFIDVTQQAEMYNREHNIANILQRALLPSRIPQIPGCDISVEYLPALKEAQVGGDFYDIFQLPDGKVGVLIGDVVGKGLSAADRVAEARYTIRSYAYLDSNPSKVLTLANNALCKERGIGSYDSLMLAAFFAVIDVKRCTMDYASGGNEPPILIDNNGVFQQLHAEGHMMGIWRDHEYHKETCAINPGDKIVMMTDGIIEAKSADSQQFGPEGVISYLANNYSKSPKALTSGILQTTINYAGGTLQDDAVIIAIAVNCNNHHET